MAKTSLCYPLVMCTEDKQREKDREDEKRKEAQERLQYEGQHPKVPIEDIKRALRRQRRRYKGE